jgi:hypothetical protein
MTITVWCSSCRPCRALGLGRELSGGSATLHRRLFIMSPLARLEMNLVIHLFVLSLFFVLGKSISGASDYDTIKYTVDKIDDIWFPSVVEDAFAGGSHTVNICFSDVKINRKIPDNVFTLQFLGVKQKDHLYDARTQTASEINDPTFPLPEYLKKLERKSISNWILICAGLFLIFLSLYRMFSRWRKRKRENINIRNISVEFAKRYKYWSINLISNLIFLTKQP